MQIYQMICISLGEEINIAVFHNCFCYFQEFRMCIFSCREWEKESYRHRTGGQASLFRALLRRFGPSVLTVGLLFLLEVVIFH